MEAAWDSLQKFFTYHLPEFIKQYWQIICAFITCVILMIMAYLHWGRGWVWADWTGFGTYVDVDGKLQRGKTLWDWLAILIGAFVAVLVPMYIKRVEERRKQTEIDIATDHQREAALQNYLDKMTELLLDKDIPLRKSRRDDEVRAVARTRTLATLRLLDPPRKVMLLQFLYEAELITKEGPIVSLFEADLSGINLSSIDLSGAFLRGVYLNGAYLFEVDLSDANLHEADLSGTDMRNANLQKADLSETNLSETLLNGANLSGANLYRANLHKANLITTDLSRAKLTGVNLSDADLRDAKMIGAELIGANLNGANLFNAHMGEANMFGTKMRGVFLYNAEVTMEQLSGAKWLEGAIMPDGKMFDPMIHTTCKTKP